MSAILPIKEAGFTLELLPKNKLGVRPSKLTQHQHDYIKINKSEIIKELQLELIRGWLYKINENESDHFLVLDKCRNNPEAMTYFLRHANGEFIHE